MKVLGYSHEQCYGDEKEAPDPRFGVSARTAMQKIGQGFRDWFGQEVWVLAAMERVRVTISRGFDCVVTDMRYKNEAVAIKEAGGFLVRIERPGLDTGTHASETSLDDFCEWDHILENSGSLNDLQLAVKEMLAVLRK